MYLAARTRSQRALLLALREATKPSGGALGVSPRFKGRDALHEMHGNGAAPLRGRPIRPLWCATGSAMGILSRATWYILYITMFIREVL